MMDGAQWLTRDALDAALPRILAAPTDGGVVELVVARPAPDERIVLDDAVLDPDEGLIGDGWRARRSRHTSDGSASRLTQLTIMNARVTAAVAGSIDRWPLAGDQLYVDLDLGTENLPPGTRLTVGTAVVEVTEQPHTGCAKFAARYGINAARFVNSPVGLAHNLRGINARIMTGGVVRRGDTIEKLSAQRGHT
jgi:hypothetical protein